MNDADFNAYKSNIRTAIRRVLSQSESGRLDEAGFPAYSHRNPLINWLFWQRLRKTMDSIEGNAPYQRVLDFGCGSGVLLPFLGSVAKNVIALDVDLIPFERMKQHIDFPANIEVHDIRIFPLDQLPAASFDLITALDVLEHVEDLPGTLTGLLRLLKLNGRLIVSGPTENIFYQIGRRVAGREYTGDYHERGIAEIKHQLGSLARVEQIAVLYWPVPLFDLFSATI
ncbi:MAG TPA: methyltransferase domain-containing protein [Anaerolineales bacterium]